MIQKDLEKSMRFLLTLSIILSVILVLLGGILYLSESGKTLFEPTAYSGKSAITFNLSHLWQDLLQFKSSALIALGLLILAFTQILRVFTVGYYFFSLKDKSFIIISAFIFLLLVFALFVPIWN
jgi:uncharacterized membrane protein